MYKPPILWAFTKEVIMKAIIYDRYSKDPSVMEVKEIDDLTEITTHEILVRVKAAAINPVDWKTRWGIFKLVTGWRFPKQMGFDMSGEVMKVGSDVTHFSKGDRVVATKSLKQGGAFAEFASVSANLTAKIPDHISFENAATLPIAGITAWVGLVEKGGVQPGMEVLILGCGGGVGSFALQIAKAYGAMVTAVVGTRHIELAKKLKADHIIDYKEKDVLQSEKKYDIIFDTPGSLSYKSAKKILKKKGSFLNINPKASNLPNLLFNYGPHKIIFIKPSRNYLQALITLVTESKLHPIIGKKVPLHKGAELISTLEKGEKITGKALLTM